ncbi:M48 family metalloprotease [Oceanimonas sp. NS1]|nr:M48 family metalloprotease [Oceanimonas sp. NS1]
MMYRTLSLALAMALTATQPAQADNSLPDIGTAGVSAMSVEREVRFGDAFSRFARANQPVVDDPVLNEYISDLGLKLLSQADSVRFPFRFLLIRDDSINASAFLGGVVQLHTGLFLYAESESELASVLAHEITHVTQRHIARYLESQSRGTPLTIAGLVGSVALAVVNPRRAWPPCRPPWGCVCSRPSTTRGTTNSRPIGWACACCTTPALIPTPWPAFSEAL